MGIREEAAAAPDVAPADMSDGQGEAAALDELDDPEERREVQRPLSETRSASVAGDARAAATAPRAEAPLQNATTAATVVTLADGPASSSTGTEASGQDGSADAVGQSPLFGGGYPLVPGEVDGAESFGGDTLPPGDGQAVPVLPDDDGSVPALAEPPGDGAFGDVSFGDGAPGDGTDGFDGTDVTDQTAGIGETDGTDLGGTPDEGTYSAQVTDGPTDAEGHDPGVVDDHDTTSAAL